jgi:hypothetical protein
MADQGAAHEGPAGLDAPPAHRDNRNQPTEAINETKMRKLSNIIRDNAAFNGWRCPDCDARKPEWNGERGRFASYQCNECGLHWDACEYECSDAELADARAASAF